jgi:hypothetical protein
VLQRWLAQLLHPPDFEEEATSLDPLLKLKADTFLVTLLPLHRGHWTLVLPLKTIFSKSLSQLGQWYSKIGMAKLLLVYYIKSKGGKAMPEFGIGLQNVE